MVKGKIKMRTNVLTKNLPIALTTVDQNALTSKRTAISQKTKTLKPRIPVNIKEHFYLSSVLS